MKKRTRHAPKSRFEKWADILTADQALKRDAGKPPLELLSEKALIEIAKVLQFGAQKYAPDGWRRGMAWRRLIGAALRHLLAFGQGEDLDPETGLSHLAHLGCCTLFLLEYQLTGVGTDDRYIRPRPDGWAADPTHKGDCTCEVCE